MKTSTKILTGATAALALVSTTFVGADAGSGPNRGNYAVRVTVENLAPGGGTIQTPVWAAVHDGSFDLYDSGAPASPELERLAEDGNTGPISALFAASGAGTDATIFGPGGPLFPGDSASHLFTINRNDADDHYFSYASMVIPSNDAFIANGDPEAIALFDAAGNPVDHSFVVLGSEVLDAGTEVNDEVPANTAALAQAAPDTGVVEGGTVELHSGFMPGGNILNAIPNGDFTQPGYETLLVHIDVEPINVQPRTIFSVLDGFQEVPANDSPSVGYANFKISGFADRITLRSQFWNTKNVVAAHLHLGARGSNGPVIVNLGALAGNDDLNDGIDGVTIRAKALTGPLAGMGLVALVAEIEAGNVYINVHTTDTPSGELRGQLVPTPS